MQVITENNETVRKDAGRLADFIMFTQRSFLLNLSKELNKGNVILCPVFSTRVLSERGLLKQ